VIDLERLYRTHAARVRDAVRGQVGGIAPEVIEDACQDAWLILCDNADRIHAQEPGALYGYLVKTAVRRAWRLATRGEAAGEPEAEGERGDRADIDELVIARERLALRRLSHRQRRMLWLRGLGMSYVEIAKATSSTRRTVERQLQRGRRALARRA
jgi:RNA polymerase sigma factor (sigma-70 family)